MLRRFSTTFVAKDALNSSISVGDRPRTARSPACASTVHSIRRSKRRIRYFPRLCRHIVRVCRCPNTASFFVCHSRRESVSAVAFAFVSAHAPAGQGPTTHPILSLGRQLQVRLQPCGLERFPKRCVTKCNEKKQIPFGNDKPSQAMAIRERL